MAEVKRTKVTTFRWFCVDSERCEAIDAALDSLVYHASQLSHYVETNEITGLECLVLDRKFAFATKELRAERARLWRRTPKITEEETLIESPKVTQPLVEYVSPFPKPQFKGGVQ
jgi:hypothetical protein